MLTHTRPQALALGLKEFHVARPCRKGPTLRTTSYKGCLECRRVVDRKYYHDKKKTPHFGALRREAQKRRNRDNPAVQLVSRAKKRAKEVGVPFSISVDDVLVPSYCPILGIPLAIGDSRSTDNSPSLDRLIPERGYVRGNIAVISQRANQIKNAASVEELRAVATWLESMLSGRDLL